MKKLIMNAALAALLSTASTAALAAGSSLHLSEA